MGELKSLRDQIAEKDKQIKLDAQKTKKMMQMFKDMKAKHTEDMEALKLKLAAWHSNSLFYSDTTAATRVYARMRV